MFVLAGRFRPVNVATPNAAFAAHAAQPYSGDPQYEGCRCYRRRGIQALDIVIAVQR
jgi:hypothetical protein